MRSVGAILCCALCAVVQTATALQSNLSTTKHHAWSQNAGWLNLFWGWDSNFAPDQGVQVTSFHLGGQAWWQNLGWVDFGDGSPNDGLRYANTSAADCGVNLVDWRGNLSGFAWSQNAGWINFGWAGPDDPNRPRLDRSTLTFSGYAWSQNLGWIYLGGGWLQVNNAGLSFVDSDFDGLPDDWELTQASNLNVLNNTSDTDGDGLPDAWEFAHFASLTASNGTQDSDGDGWSDAVEFRAGTNPADANSPGPYPAPPPGTTIDESAPYAWAQNLGWIAGRYPQVDNFNYPAGIYITRYHLYGSAWAQNAGWINFGDGTPRDGLRYSNTNADDCGVNMDCDFNLSGYAWSQNFGWINFGWAAANDVNRPRVKFDASYPNHFVGYAWSQNAGWVNLTIMNIFTVANAQDGDVDGLPDQWEYHLAASLNVLNGAIADTDHDGLLDAWEFANFRSLAITDGSGDFDQDGSTDREEFLAGSNPRDAFSLPPPTGSTIASAAFGKFAWSQNAGWINFRHDRPQAPSGIIVREYFLAGQAWGQNLGWVDLGRGAPTNGIRYGNAATNDTGVNHDAGGNLSGFAWSQSAGWVNFGWAAANHPDRARLNLASGKFSGYVWAQNLGWINLDTGLQTLSIDLVDTDGDGLDDGWERTYFSNLTTATATTDTDGDGQTDLQEFIAGSNPNDAASVLQIVAHSIDATHTLESLTFTSSARRQYRVLRSPDLINWVPSFNGWQPGAEPLTQTFEFLPAPAEQQFFRINARRPLTP